MIWNDGTEVVRRIWSKPPVPTLTKPCPKCLPYMLLPDVSLAQRWSKVAVLATGQIKAKA